MSNWGAEEPAAPSSGAWNAGFTSPPAAPAASGFDAGPAPAAANDGGDLGYGGDDAVGDVDNRACRICNQEGHLARECPDKPDNFGACFNCGEQGHSKTECPNPRVFTGTCRLCNEAGHPAKECPTKPPQACKSCGQEGHIVAECTNNRLVDRPGIAQVSCEDAYENLKKADAARDFDLFKQYMFEYIRAAREAEHPVSMHDVEVMFRDNNFGFYLFGLTAEVSFDKVIVGPNGEMDLKYIWSLNKTKVPRRSKAIAPRKAKTEEENLERLQQAGQLMDELRPFCLQCKEKGHMRRECEADPIADEHERVVIKCTNCEGLDHRQRDCPQPRKPDFNPNVCRNCNEEGHKASECEKPRMANEHTECRKCNKTGHYAKDCPDAPKRVCFNCQQEGHGKSECTNEKVMKCRNCDELGHEGRDCPKPRDITRVKCRKCEQMGHFESRCPNPAPAPEEDEPQEYPAADAPVEPTPASNSSAPGWAAAPIETGGGW